MSLNSWLCRNFARDDKEYVTPSDVIMCLLDDYGDEAIIIIIMSVLWYTVSSISAIEQGMISPEYPSTWFDLFVVLIKSWVVPLEYIIPAIIALYAFYKLMTVKIAKCPWRKDE